MKDPAMKALKAVNKLIKELERTRKDAELRATDWHSAINVKMERIRQQDDELKRLRAQVARIPSLEKEVIDLRAELDSLYQPAPPADDAAIAWAEKPATPPKVKP